MALEIEAKLKVDALGPVRRRLGEQSAIRIGARVETNLFFDTADHALRAADQGLRLRISRDERAATEEVVLTFKGPNRSSELKIREETELLVGSREGARKMLAHLGYQITLSFEKRRESWRLNDCLVELDELPLAGSFVEIEGPDEATVLRTRELLGLGDVPLVKDHYVALLIEQLRRRGDLSRDITFAAFGTT